MLTDATWVDVKISPSSTFKTARLKVDENGWQQVAVLMPPGSNFPKDPGPVTCVVEFISGQAMYKVEGRTYFSRPNVQCRIPAGHSFEIKLAFTEVLWILHYPPKLVSI